MLAWFIHLAKMNMFRNPHREVTRAHYQSVFFQSTLGSEAHEYQVAYVPEEVTPSIGAVALQEHSLETTDLPAVSSVNGKAIMSCGLMAMP